MDQSDLVNPTSVTLGMKSSAVQMDSQTIKLSAIGRSNSVGVDKEYWKPLCCLDIISLTQKLSGY